MSPLVNEWDAVTKNPAAPTAGFWFQVISASPLIAAEIIIAETARSSRSAPAMRGNCTLKRHVG
jgi:hypothetical protein